MESEESAQSRIARDLAEARAELLASLAGLDAAGFDRPTSNEPWNVRATVGHLCAAEPSMIRQIERALRGEDATVSADFDLNVWNARQVEKRAQQSRESLLAELESNRGKTLALLAGMTDEDLRRACSHPLHGDVTVGRILEVIAGHEREHAEQIRQSRS